MQSRSMESQKLINEKSLQRYVFECLSLGDRDLLRRTISPGLYKTNARIRVVIPEYPIHGLPHRTDFRIVYSDNTYHDVEVEWKTSRFNHGADVCSRCYSRQAGFIIVLEDDRHSCRSSQAYLNSANICVIDPDEFSYWFLSRAKHIVDGTISNHVETYSSRSKKNWLVFLASAGKKGGKSREDYVRRGRRAGRWAFRFSRKTAVMRNVLDIVAGDVVVFVWDFEYGRGVHGRQLYPDKSWGFTGLDIVQVTNGYYCDFRDRTFEADSWAVDSLLEKQYMHYFEFRLPNRSYERIFYRCADHSVVRYPTEEPARLRNDKDWSGFVMKLRWSCNNEGAPAEISEEELNCLLRQIRRQ